MRRLLVPALAVLAAGCTAHPEPIVDTKGVNMAAYQRDLAECQEYAAQINPAAGVAKGAVAGAAVGAAGEGRFRPLVRTDGCRNGPAVSKIGTLDFSSVFRP